MRIKKNVKSYKKVNFCILLSLFTICSCATLNYEQYEDGNLYYENGKIYKIVAKPDFISWRKNYHDFRSMDKYEPMSEFEELVGYRYTNWRARPRQYLKASLYKIDVSEEIISPLSFKLINNIIETGAFTKDRVTYNYCIYTSRNTSGYTYLNKIFAKEVEKENGQVVWIVYSEDVSYNKDLRYFLKDWKYVDTYSRKQRILYNRFLKNADGCFKVMQN